MLKIVFLAEPFVKVGDSYVSKKNSLDFVKTLFSESKLVCVGSLDYQSNGGESAASSRAPVNEACFEAIYGYKSLVDFVKKCLKSPKFLHLYIKRCSEILDKYPNSDVWVRNPSLGSVIFSLLALKRERVLYNHMCANAIRGWESEKYSWYIKPFAFAFSRILKMLIVKIISHENTINLCTGSELEKFCEKYSDNVYQLVDSNIQSTRPFLNKKSDTPFKFLFVGRIQKDKGVIDLIEAFLKIQADNNVVLEIVGDGPILEELKSRYNCQSTVNFKGYVKNEEISNYIQTSDVVVVPSRNRYEGFPRVIMESWSCGIPVVASDVGGVGAFLVNGKNGLLYDYRRPGELERALRKVLLARVHSCLVEGVAEVAPLTTKEYWIKKLKRDIGV